VAEETLRGAATPPLPARGEDQVPVFWRIFGATLLSIASLIAITLYQQVYSGLHDLHTEVRTLTEGYGDLVKKDEFTARNVAATNNLKEVQAHGAAAMDLWRERAAQLEKQIKAGDDEVKQQARELAREVQRLRERLAVLENRPAATPASSTTHAR
jgi:hypothetical protein